MASSCASDAARMPIPPATTVASTVFSKPSWLGDRPISNAFASFSEAARVASPKRVQRYNAHRITVAAITMPVSQNRSAGMPASATRTMSLGSTEGRRARPCRR